MSTKLFLCLACVAFSLVGPSLPAQTTPPAFGRIAPFEDEFGSGGFIELEVAAPADSLVILQSNGDLASPEWADVSEPVVSAGQPVVFNVPSHTGENDPGIPQRFFRFLVQSYDLAINDDGESTALEIAEPTPIGVVFESLSRQLGADVFPTAPIDYSSVLEPGSLKSSNPQDLLGQTGMRLWITPPAKDDSTFARRFPGNESLQENPLPDDPQDVGEGKMEDGFIGFDLPRPNQGTLEPPEPGPNSDKPFLTDIPDPKEESLQEVDPQFQEPGRHLRLLFDVKLEGGITPITALMLPGDALRMDPDNPETPFWPRNPSLASLVWVVRSPLADPNSPEQIYYIGAVEDPFTVRSYDPPPPMRGSHGAMEKTESQIRVPIPVLEKDTQLSELVVEFYRYAEPGDFEILDPKSFLRGEGNFKLIGEIKGEEILKLIETTRPQAANPAPASPSGTSVRALGALPAPTVTQLFSSGSRASKFNFVVIGEGFANVPADQTTFNNYVNNTVMRDLLERDVHPEILNGINIFRVNTFSQQSGVTRVNASGNVTTARNTALQYRYSGIWSRCWMEPGPNSVALMNGIINGLVPEVDGIAVVLNVNTQGGCSYPGSHFAVTLNSSWATFAHEFGHFFASQQDEYQCNQGAMGCGVYGGPEVPEVNQTRVTARNQIKWNVWIPPTRPVPTALANIVDTSQDVGLFPGGTRSSQQWWNGLYRPSWRGRMNNNTPPHNPVGYTAVRNTARGFQEGDFRKSVVGDFNGDGRTDLVILDDRQLSLYLAADRDVGPNDPITGSPPRSVTGVLEPTWYHTDLLRNAAQTRSWEFRRNDILVPADFNGDGMTDLYVINLNNWNKPYLSMLRSNGDSFEPVRRYDLQLPGWDDMRDHDEFYAGDFTGDGSDDLMVFNGRDWNIPYFILLRSTGTQLVYSRRYDQFLPGWEMGRNEKFFVGDYNGDGREEVISQNTQDWNQVHLMVFRSTGAALALADRYYGTIQSGQSLFWTMRRQDELVPLNFDGDATTDLAIFNGRNWGPEYLILFACTRDEGRLSYRRRYDDRIPGWDMRRRDKFYAADVNGDGNDDLVVYNGVNWSTQYLGILRSDGDSALQGSWQDDWIGGWNLGANDQFHVADFRGNGGWDDLFVYNQGWFGLLRSYQNRYALEAINRKWIHNHRYHAFGWW